MRSLKAPWQRKFAQVTKKALEIKAGTKIAQSAYLALGQVKDLSGRSKTLGPSKTLSNLRSYVLFCQ